ncbi:MAG: cytidylate kinase-like family protein [Desulfobacterota bacterium]|nr:cytidylate kinase-like family protein [Thermodesulfobacteriota bacterium]
MDIEVPKRLINKAVAQYAAEIKKKTEIPSTRHKKIITISRQLGTGGRKIAEAVGARLGCTVWGKEILDVLASQAGGEYTARMFEALDENTQGVIDALVSDLFGQVAKHTYLHLLPKAIFVIAQNDAVIIGRGSHLLLPDSFRVRIKASFETRVNNMMRFEHLDRKTAEQRIKENDRQREAFMKDLARKLNIKEYHDQFDLGINTDRFDIAEATEIIVHAFRIFQQTRT